MNELITQNNTDHISLETRIIGGEAAVSAEVSRVTAIFNGGIIVNTLKVSTEVAANAFVTTSDMRLKKDVEEISNALETVLSLHPVYYNWVDGRNTINPGHKELGFLAQELETAMPAVVATDADGLKRVAYDRVVAMLVAAVKELKADVEALKARL